MFFNTRKTNQSIDGFFVKFKKIKRGKFVNTGFTLIETVIALSIFAIATTYSLSIFVQSNQVQKRTANTERTTADARYALEMMTRNIHAGAIDYEYYGADPFPWPLGILALRDVNDQLIQFRRVQIAGSQSAVQVCSGVEICTADDWQDLTPANLDVKRLAFYISPNQNPNSINGATMDYYSNQQPMVTIVMETINLNESDPTIGVSHWQTTISTRNYGR